jgi:hypothetical protein
LILLALVLALHLLIILLSAFLLHLLSLFVDIAELLVEPLILIFLL